MSFCKPLVYLLILAQLRPLSTIKHRRLLMSVKIYFRKVHAFVLWKRKMVGAAGKQGYRVGTESPNKHEYSAMILYLSAILPATSQKQLF